MCCVSNSIDCGPTKHDPVCSTSCDFLFHHIEGIAAYCDHPVRLGVAESINTTIKAVLRRARGMRDEQMLLLKLK
jgi:transposase